MSKQKSPLPRLRISVIQPDGTSKTLSIRANNFSRELSEKINGFVSENLIKK